MGRARCVGALVLVALVAGLPMTARADDVPEYVQYGPTNYWRDRDLTWSLRGASGDLTSTQEVDAIQAALDTWADVSQLTFTKVDDCTATGGNGEPCAMDQDEPDLRIWFTQDPHSNNVSQDPAFNGVNPGHAIYPGTADTDGLFGDIHLDAGNFTWYVDGSHVPDLQSIVTHEAGHALGLRHADYPQTGVNATCPAQASPTRPIMCPVIIGVQHTLAPDDIAGIQLRYGRPSHYVDSTIRRAADRVAVGNDIVNTSARGQSATYNRARGGTAVFYVRVTNDGTEDDDVLLDAPTAPAGFAVRYYVGADGRVAATGIIPGTFSRPLDPDEGVTVRVEVTVKPGAVRNRSQGVAIRATSQADGHRVDVVRAVVHVT